MAKPKVDPVAWAKAVVRDRGGPRCSTCNDPVVSVIVKKWASMWRAGETSMSIQQALEFLKANYGYKRSHNSLGYCLRNHHTVTTRG